MERPGSRPDNKPLTRRERRAIARQKIKGPPRVDQGRRDLLKMITPFGWVPEAIRRGGIGDLSSQAKVSLAKDAGLAASATGIAVVPVVKEATRERTLKEKVLAFTWKDAEDKEKLKAFVTSLADGYLRLTQTPRLKKEDLIGKDRTNIYETTEAYRKSIKVVEPTFDPGQTDWGYTHYKTKKVFIDFNSVKKQAVAQSLEAGLVFLDVLWHEWGHLDVEERAQGELINNPAYYFYSPVSKMNESFRKYRGGAIYTDTYYGYLRFEEAWNESIIARRIVEQVGFDKEMIFLAGDYYENGTDFFPKFTSAINIPLDVLYQMHATSDFEGFAKLIGQSLPGDSSSLTKGVKLFTGIHNSDVNAIKQTGVFERMQKK